MKQYVGAGPRRVTVQPVRYRPGRRAVLKHRLSWARGTRATLFVRVMPPARFPRFLEAGQLSAQSGFAVPRVAGSWPEGGVVWMSEVPGKTLRHYIRQGEGTAPELVLDALEPLWHADAPAGTGRTLPLAADYRYSRDVLEGLVRDDAARTTLRRITAVLDPFAKQWEPTAFAHNDFYDDQVIVMPDGRLAIVDFDEVGPGDPMVDVGNTIAHLAWDARFSEERAGGLEDSARFQELAFGRFGWDPHELDLRVAYSLFRIAPNPARQMQDGWLEKIGTALELTATALEGDA